MKFSKSKNYLFYLLSAGLLALVFSACTKIETAPVYDEITTEATETEVLEEEVFYVPLSEELAALSLEELKEYYKNNFTQEEFEQLREEYKDYVPEAVATTAASSRWCGPSQHVQYQCWVVNDCSSGKRQWEQRRYFCDHRHDPYTYWIRRGCCGGPH